MVETIDLRPPPSKRLVQRNN